MIYIPISYSEEEANKILAENNKPHIKVCSDVQGVSYKMDFYCEIHNLKWTSTFYELLHQKYSCPNCIREGRVNTYLSHYNLFDIAPEVACLLANPNDAIGCSKNSKYKKWFKCPNCNNLYYKSVTNVSNNGLACTVCSDGFSYPNKLMYQILKQLNIYFITEFSPSWLSPKRYDFYLEKGNEKYVVEMDGGLGHGKKIIPKSKIRTLEESLKIDLEKDILAEKHGINVIRINADISELNFIKNNIKESDLNLLFQLDKINWKQCEIEARKSLLLKACELYSKYPFLSYKELKHHLHLSEETICRYLRIGATYGLCKSYKYAGGKHVICLDSNIIFRTSSEAGRFYNIDEKRISKCCKGYYNHACSLHFQYLSDFHGNIDDLEPNLNIKPRRLSEKRKVNMYDKKFNYIKTYESVTAAAEDNKTALKIIIKSCTSVHKYNYGKTYYYADDPNQPDKSKIIA